MYEGSGMTHMKVHIYKHGTSASNVFSGGCNYKPGFIMSHDHVGSVGREIKEIK
jgi:hypothetical protein